MEREHLGIRYTTDYFEDFQDGFGAIDLFASTSSGEKEKVARVTYWDAMGQCTIEVFGKVVPTEILDEAIAECYARNQG